VVCAIPGEVEEGERRHHIMVPSHFASTVMKSSLYSASTAPPSLWF